MWIITLYEAETADILEMYDVHIEPCKQYVHHQIYPIVHIQDQNKRLKRT